MDHDRTLSSNGEANVRIPADVRSIFGQVRHSFRRYVIAVGISLVAAWLVVWFWVAITLDRGPVFLGLAELSLDWRVVLLVVAVAVVSWLLITKILMRVGVSLPDQSIALLIERRFPAFGDRLATLTSRHDESGEGHDLDTQAALEQKLVVEVQQRLATIKIQELFNMKTLRRVQWLALALVASFVGFAIWQPTTAVTGLRRLVLLHAIEWPRECRLELVGLRVQDQRVPESVANANTMQPLVDQTIFVARGASVSLSIRAELPNAENPQRRLPRRCQLQYRCDDGRSGKIPMNAIGGPREGFQTYAVDGSILDGISSNVTCYVRGDDHRIGPWTIEAIEPPITKQVVLDVRYPDYLVDVASSRWTPRSIPLAPGLALPGGTRVELNIESDRRVEKVYLVDSKGELASEATVQPGDGRQFQASLGTLKSDLQLNVWLRDRHGIFSQSPTRVAIGATEDKPPTVKFRLSGIGTAVTPGVRIPVGGLVTDDYDIQSSWAYVSTAIADGIELPVSVSAQGELDGEVDFLELRRSGLLPTDLPVGDGSQVTFTVYANDRYDLAEAPNTGAGDRYTLDVVSPAELLRMLERQEADQRRRLEQISEELLQARDNLARSVSNNRSAETGLEPGDRPTNGDSTAGTAQDWSVRQLFVQRSLLQSQKSTQELSAMAIAFDEIRGQLINNRIDAEDRKVRIADTIVAPLRHIADESLVELTRQLKELDELYRQNASASGSANRQDEVNDGTRESLAKADDVLAEVQAVLGALLKFETQNELLDIVRRLLDQEQELLQRTKAIREQEAFNELFGK